MLRCRAAFAAVLALALVPTVAAADVVPLAWESAELGVQGDTAPVTLLACCDDVTYTIRSESWDVGPFSLSGSSSSVSGTSWFEIDGNRWSYGIDDFQTAGTIWAAGVGFAARFRVPPGDDVQFIGFSGSGFEAPPYETDPPGPSDIEIFVAGTEVTLFRSMVFGSPGAVGPHSGEIELYWITPEPGGVATGASGLLALAAVRRRRRSHARILVPLLRGAGRCA